MLEGGQCDFCLIPSPHRRLVRLSPRPQKKLAGLAGWVSFPHSSRHKDQMVRSRTPSQASCDPAGPHLGPVSSKYAFLRSDRGQSPVLPSLGPLLLLGPSSLSLSLLTPTSLPPFSPPLLCSASSLLGPPLPLLTYFHLAHSPPLNIKACSPPASR